MKCPDCGSDFPHVCIPCHNEEDRTEFRSICGDIDVPSGLPVIYFIDHELASEMDESSGVLADILLDLPDDIRLS